MEHTPPYAASLGHVAYDQYSLQSRYESMYMSAYTSNDSNGYAAFNDQYTSTPATYQQHPYSTGATPSSNWTSSSSSAMSSSSDLSNYHRHVRQNDFFSTGASSSLSTNNNSTNNVDPKMSILKSALNQMRDTAFNPYGPPKAKQPRHDDYSSPTHSCHNNNDNSSLMTSKPTLNVMPTVNLMSLKSSNSNGTSKSSISPLVSRLRLNNNNNIINNTSNNGSPSATRDSLLLCNGSFSSPLPSSTTVTPTIASQQLGESPRTARLTNGHYGSLSSLSSVSTVGCSPQSQTKTDLVSKYGKVGRFVFNNDNKPMLLFFTRVFYFSNHYICERLRIDGVSYSCTEQYYMYYKAYVFGDLACARAIMQTNDPTAIKRLGANVAGFDAGKWANLSILVMTIASLRKYEQNAELRRQLFRTMHSELAEANPTDHRWGIGLSIHAETVMDKRSWRGENLMGRLLMHLRDRLMRRPEFAAEVREIYAQHPYDPNGEFVLTV